MLLVLNNVRHACEGAGLGAERETRAVPWPAAKARYAQCYVVRKVTPYRNKGIALSQRTIMISYRTSTTTRHHNQLRSSRQHPARTLLLHSAVRAASIAKGSALRCYRQTGRLPMHELHK